LLGGGVVRGGGWTRVAKARRGFWGWGCSEGDGRRRGFPEQGDLGGVGWMLLCLAVRQSERVCLVGGV